MEIELKPIPSRIGHKKLILTSSIFANINQKAEALREICVILLSFPCPRYHPLIEKAQVTIEHPRQIAIDI
jgi:hypothetical protein